MNTFENILAPREAIKRNSARDGKRLSVAGRIRAKAAEIVDFALAAVFAATWGGLWYFGFHLLATRAKNLGYINVTAAIAVICGAAFAALGVAVAVRGVRRLKAQKK